MVLPKSQIQVTHRGDGHDSETIKGVDVTDIIPNTTLEIIVWAPTWLIADKGLKAIEVNA